MTGGNQLNVRIISMNELHLKQDGRDIHITVKPSIGELPGGIRLQHISTVEGKGFIDIDFEDPFPYVSVYESGGESIYIGLGSPLTEGLKVTLELSAGQAEEFIRDIQKQLNKRRAHDG